MIASKSERRYSRVKIAIKLGVAAYALGLSSVAQAVQTEDPPSAGLEDIVVTAQKRGIVERAQEVPLAVTALTGDALENGQIRDLTDLMVAVPNVKFSSAGTIPGVANFEIRGFGIASSIPSVEPAVGVFVDGVYQGTNYGIITDLFDLESVEILRGPQGTLFGRNTTGGAVLLRTRRPGDSLGIRFKTGIETGPLVSAAVSVDGPIAGPRLRGKITAFYSHDDGYFKNRFDGRDVGKLRSAVGRATLLWEPVDAVDTTLIYERGRQRGDGSPATNSLTQDKFSLNINNPGSTRTDWQSLTSETNWQVGLGDGVVTNVAGWRRLKQDAGTDVDGLPFVGFEANAYLKQHQFSNELRYAGTFGPLSLTTGVYYFEQEIFYIEERRLGALAGRPVAFGGKLDVSSWATFFQAAYSLTPQFKLIAGARYGWEKKSAAVATFSAAAPRCDYPSRTCAFNFPGPSFAEPGSKSWRAFTPKLTAQWQPTEDFQIYGGWSQGVRSGGYNVRSTSASIGPGPYGQERQDAFELGFKSEWLNRRLRINGAAFRNRIKDLQRDINLPDPISGAVQITRNAADITIDGIEIEVLAQVTPSLRLGASAGYLDGDYDRLRFDLNGSLPGLGQELELARLSPASYSVDATYETRIFADTALRLNVNYGYRQAAPYTDNNIGMLSKIKDLSASVALTDASEQLTISLFGRNLLDRVVNNAAVPLPASAGGGVFLPISKGRALGLELRVHY